MKRRGKIAKPYENQSLEVIHFSHTNMVIQETRPKFLQLQDYKKMVQDGLLNLWPSFALVQRAGRGANENKNNIVPKFLGNENIY